MKLKVQLIENETKLAISNLNSDTQFILPYNEELSYIKNIVTALGSKYGVVEYCSQDDGDYITLKELKEKL